MITLGKVLICLGLLLLFVTTTTLIDNWKESRDKFNGIEKRKPKLRRVK